MKEHVAVQHHKPISQMLPGQPKRIHAAGFSELCVFHEADVAVAFFTNGISAKTDNHYDVLEVHIAQGLDLSSQKCYAANIDQALWLHRAVETRSFSGP